VIFESESFEISCPASSTIQSYSLSIPERIFKKVDFPLPLGPIIAINWPSERIKSVFSKILTFSQATLKDFSKCCICIIFLFFSYILIL
jgi:hypothetical protein